MARLARELAFMRTVAEQIRARGADEVDLGRLREELDRVNGTLAYAWTMDSATDD